MSKMPKMQPVVSDPIAEIGYNAESEDLYVNFNSGKVYVYRNVPEETYDNLMSADSHGNFFNRNIRGAFVCEPL